MRDAPFLGPLRERKHFCIYGNFCEEFERYVKGPCKWADLCIGALLGNLEGVRLLGLLKEKENAYLVSFSWTQRTLQVTSGAIWNFSKEQDFLELISDYGAQTDRLKGLGASGP